MRIEESDHPMGLQMAPMLSLTFILLLYLSTSGDTSIFSGSREGVFTTKNRGATLHW